MPAATWRHATPAPRGQRVTGADVAGRSADKPTPRRGLIRTAGGLVVALSALSQEFGSGINYLVPQGLGQYPGAQNLIPLAIFVAGLLFIPHVSMFCRYTRIMPHAGSVYVWLTRALGPIPGFVVSFVWFVGLCGSTGFVAFVCATFVGNTLHSIGLPFAWAETPFGHLSVGLAAIWSLALLHCTGVRQYGRFLYVVSGCILAAVVIIVVTGFSTSPDTAVGVFEGITGVRAAPRPADPSMGQFFSIVALFMFAYGGLSGGSSLGGETIDPAKAMPRGIVMGWALALVSYTLVAFAIFHAVRWWLAVPVLESGYGHLLTAPSLIGLLSYRPVAVFLNVLTAIVVIKTIAPQLLCLSRFLYAWSEDGFAPGALQVTNRVHTPARAVVVSALLASIFLVQSVFSSWAIGVAMRSLSIMLTSVMLGIGVLVLCRGGRMARERPYAEALSSGIAIKAMAVAAVVVGVLLIAFVVHQPEKSWYFQPWFQVIVSVGIALLLVRYAMKRRDGGFRRDFRSRFLEVPD